MRFRIVSIPATFVAAVLMSAAFADAGQVRVNVTGSNTFSPDNVTVNQGDQVVWFWVGTGHSVTSGTGCGASGSLFNSGVRSAGTRFAWKSENAGAVGYVCLPHCATMDGVITVQASGASVSDFRITEVRVSSTAPHTVDFIEITNLGTAQGNLGRYRVVTAGVTSEIPVNDLLVNAGARVVVHPGSTGANTNADIFLPAVTMTVPGSVGLYVPNSVNTSLTDATMLADFVQWGAAAQANEATAATALFWTAGAFIPQVADGHSMEFCGAGTDRGPAFWRGISVPNPGTTGNCTTPVESVTWGAIKTLHR
jgi:plastocyanin